MQIYLIFFLEGHYFLDIQYLMFQFSEFIRSRWLCGQEASQTINLKKGDIDAIICFGVIVKGATLHFEMISYECMRGLGKVMADFRRPVVVEVLPVFDIQEAAERAADDEFTFYNPDIVPQLVREKAPQDVGLLSLSSVHHCDLDN